MSSLHGAAGCSLIDATLGGAANSRHTDLIHTRHSMHDAARGGAALFIRGRGRGGRAAALPHLRGVGPGGGGAGRAQMSGMGGRGVCVYAEGDRVFRAHRHTSESLTSHGHRRRPRGPRAAAVPSESPRPSRRVRVAASESPRASESPAPKTFRLAAPESSLPRHRIRVAASGRQGQVVVSESPSPSRHLRVTASESSPPSRLVRV